jgi:tetratricopeptide (TPR) repeat protein
LALGLTVAIGLKNEVNTREIITIKENHAGIEKGEKEDKQKLKRINNNQGNSSRFKLLLYVVIALLTVFLCITVTRPFIARTYWYYGDREIRRKNLNEAIRFYNEGLKWDPYLGQIYYNTGKILQSRKIYSIALEYFEKAEKYVDRPGLPQDFAFIYLKKGQLNKAATKIGQAISYQPDEKSMVPLYSELGNVYLQLRKYKPAEIAFKDALKINPDFVNAHYGLAGAYLRQNQQAGALEEFQKVIELDPDSMEAKYSQTTIQKIAQEKLKDQPEEKRDSENK